MNEIKRIEKISISISSKYTFKRAQCITFLKSQCKYFKNLNSYIFSGFNTGKYSSWLH